MPNKLPNNTEKARTCLKAWWEKEIIEAGLSSAPVTVAHSRIEDVKQEEGLVMHLLNILAGDETECKNIYTAAIPGAPWAMDTGVFTTKTGMVSHIVYALTFPHKVRGKLTFLVEEGALKVYGKFEGKGADTLNQNKGLVKLLFGSLSRAYGFWTSMMYMARPSFQLIPGKNGTDVAVTTTLRGNFGFSQKKLGLKKVIEGLKALETAIRS